MDAFAYKYHFLNIEWSMICSKRQFFIQYLWIWEKKCWKHLNEILLVIYQNPTGERAVVCDMEKIALGGRVYMSHCRSSFC